MSTNLKETRPCPNCGKPLPVGVLAGLCPACLIAQGGDTDTGYGKRRTHFEPPPLAEIAKLFPQLEILNLLGAGGMGAVYKARQPALDRVVALKILPATGAGGVDFSERFNREARALARLSHPNIVAVHEFGQAGTLSFFIMEFVDGANLRQLEQGARLSPREALQIIPQICDALQYAHDEGVVHRDIKPENVLIDRRGRVKIADFGLAKILGHDPEAARLTAEGQVMGTPHYMAPEQVEKPLAVDHRADIYALGVVFYEMLTGDLPLGKFAPPSRKVQVDVRLDDVVLRALENDPARRYQKASEVKSQVETIVSTPEAASMSIPKSRREFVRWAGFPLVERSGERHAVHWLGVAHAFVVIFALLTIVFGLVSSATGRSLWDWFGIVGLPSVLVRLGLSAGLAGLGLRLAWLKKDRPESAPGLPKTPQGTVILPAERLSRKALAGVCWAPLFFMAGFLYFMVRTVVHVPDDATTIPEPTVQWWQILLGVTLLPLGLTAPFGTTILGWLAVGDIRRSRGRISGLPLALFDGLFFPLLALDIFLYQGLVQSYYWFAAEVMKGAFANPPYVVIALGACIACVQVDWWIIRRVWRTVRLDGGVVPRASGDWWWSSRRGGVVLAVLCVAVIVLVAGRRSQSGEVIKADQIAERELQTGRLIAKLPRRGTVELLAIGERYGALNGWWAADGTPLSNSLYEVRRGVDNVMGNRVPKEFLFRESDLPDGASNAGIAAEPYSASGWGGEVFLNGQRVPGARQVRMAWEAPVKIASIQIGYALEPWRTIVAHDTGYRSSQHRHLRTDPQWTMNFHHSPIDTDNGAQIAIVFGPDDRKWTHRMVAVDTNGVEHPYSQANATPIEKLTLFTYTFHKLPLAMLKEFRLQVRPVYWVEFRDVALAPKAPLPPPEPSASVELWSPGMAAGQTIDLNQIRDKANELMNRGDYEESLQRHLWIHNHALEVDPNMAGVRLSFYLMDWVELGRRYPRARKAMIETRDRKTRELERGGGTAELFADVSALNRELKAEESTVALFKQIHEGDPQLAARCFPHVKKALVVHREYALCLNYIPDLRRHLQQLRLDHDNALRHLEKNPGPQTATLRASTDRLFADNISLVLEALRGVGRSEEAVSIRDEAIRLLADPSLLPEAVEAQDKPTETGVLVK